MTAIDLTAATSWVTAALGIVAPLLVALFNRPQWSSLTKQRIALGTSVVLAVLGFTLTGGFANFALENLAVVLIAVYGLSQATYALIWKPSGVAPAVEQATSPTVVDALPGSTGQHAARELDTDELGRLQLPDDSTT